MAALVDTVWTNGVWADTVWAAGVWGAQGAVVATARGGDDAPAKTEDIRRRRKRAKELREARDRHQRDIRKTLEEAYRLATEGPQESVAAIEAVVEPFIETRRGRKALDFNALARDAEAIDRLVRIISELQEIEFMRDEEEAILLLCA